MAQNADDSIRRTLTEFEDLLVDMLDKRNEFIKKELELAVDRVLKDYEDFINSDDWGNLCDDLHKAVEEAVDDV